MSLAQVQHEEFTLRVFNSCYMDYGLEILKGDESIFYNPHFLSCDSYGFNESEEENEDYPKGSEPEIESKPWTEKEWEECLKSEADDLIDSAIGWHNLEEKEEEIK